MMLMVPRNSDLKKALVHMTDRAERSGSFNAEIVPDVTPQWYVLTCVPGQESIAAGHLIGRRFAIYQPQIQKVTFVKGRKHKRMHNLFPGYLFVRVWDLDHHRRRLCACTGVRGILSTVNGTPVTVPWSEIDRIRAQENVENPLIMSVEVITRRRARRKKRSKETAETYIKEIQVDPDEIVSVTSKSYWRMPEPERFEQLHKALSLPQGTVFKGLTESP